MTKNIYRLRENNMYVRIQMTTKHFVVDVEYLNDIALNIAENVPVEYYSKFCKELNLYLKCAIVEEISDSSDENLSDNSGSDLCEEEYEVEVDDDGFYTLAECDVKDCNAVGKENNNLTIVKE